LENICTGHPLPASEAITAPDSRARGGTLQNTAFANTLAGGEEVSRTKVNSVNQVSFQDGADLSKEEVIARLNSFPQCPAEKLKVQWFYKKRVTTYMSREMEGEIDYRWIPYEIFENTVLERAYQAGVDRVEFGAGHFPVIVSERKQYDNLNKRHRDLLRGTWYLHM
jgi:hypothetical protein